MKQRPTRARMRPITSSTSLAGTLIGPPPFAFHNSIWKLDFEYERGLPAIAPARFRERASKLSTSGKDTVRFGAYADLGKRWGEVRSGCDGGGDGRRRNRLLPSDLLKDLTECRLVLSDSAKSSYRYCY
jgi:hypothetical protein